MKKFFPIFGFIILAVIVSLQVYNPFGREAAPSRGEHLANYVPDTAAGWEVEDRDIGPTESLRQRAIGILNFDEYIYRHYSREGGREFFEVYIAYWAPGKASTMEVSSHTPDRCWTENGWRVLERRHAVQGNVGDIELLPSEWRTFEIEGHRQYVHFWHLVGGKPYAYGQRINAYPSPITYVRDVLQSEILGTGEQYFIRVNTNIPFEDLWHNPGFQSVLRELSAIGLAKTPEMAEQEYTQS